MTTIKTGNRRLLKLAAFLEKLPRKRFDYRAVVGWDWKGKQDLSCGTTGCAIGWACAMPGFRRLGLHIDGYHKAAGGFADGTYGCAGTDTFSLSEGDWLFLFQPREHGFPRDMLVSPLPKSATPKQVAKHIRRFVARRDEGGAQ